MVPKVLNSCIKEYIRILVKGQYTFLPKVYLFFVFSCTPDIKNQIRSHIIENSQPIRYISTLQYCSRLYVNINRKFIQFLKIPTLSGKVFFLNFTLLFTGNYQSMQKRHCLISFYPFKFFVYLFACFNFMMSPYNDKVEYCHRKSNKHFYAPMSAGQPISVVAASRFTVRQKKKFPQNAMDFSLGTIYNELVMKLPATVLRGIKP